jgi:hypothetical protein
MAFVSVMGVVVLFTSLTGYQLKAEERQGKSNFYDAETAMNELRAGVQQTVSDAIAAAYTDVLVHYGASPPTPCRPPSRMRLWTRWWGLVSRPDRDPATHVVSYTYIRTRWPLRHCAGRQHCGEPGTAGERACRASGDAFVLRGLSVRARKTGMSQRLNRSHDPYADFVYRRSGTFSSQSLESFMTSPRGR